MDAVTPRLNLDAIECALRAFQGDSHRNSGPLADAQDPMSDEVVNNMMAGYRAIDEFVATDTDLLAVGSSRHRLDLNEIVLCGPDWEARHQSTDHVKANETYFYDDAIGGVGDIVEWYSRHNDESVRRRAVGIYVRILGEPQLYMEGNHRTGAIIMSYVLLRGGQPPFVVTSQCAEMYFWMSAQIKKNRKYGIISFFKLLKIRRRFASFLRDYADFSYLR